MRKYHIIVLFFLICQVAHAWERSDLHDLNLKGPVKTLVYFSGKDTSSIKYFDIHGNAVMIKYFENGQPGSTMLFTHVYTVSGRLLSSVSGSNRTEYKYDKAGDLIEADRYDLSNGALKQRTKYLKGRKGQDSVVLEYDAAGHLNDKMFVESWDAGRKQMFWRYMDSGKVVMRNDYIYDASHDVECHYSFDNFSQHEVESTVNYTYWGHDDRDNWTHSKFHVNRSVKEMNRVDDWDEGVERWIEYY